MVKKIPNREFFWYLELIIHKDCENVRLIEDVYYRIRVVWIMWRSALRVSCDHRMPIKLKGKYYKSVIRLAILYVTKCWAIWNNMLKKGKRKKK